MSNFLDDPLTVGVPAGIGVCVYGILEKVVGNDVLRWSVGAKGKIKLAFYRTGSGRVRSNPEYRPRRTLSWSPFEAGRVDGEQCQEKMRNFRL